MHNRSVPGKGGGAADRTKQSRAEKTAAGGGVPFSPPVRLHGSSVRPVALPPVPGCSNLPQDNRVYTTRGSTGALPTHIHA